jgi:uncharacterized protein YkwD
VFAIAFAVAIWPSQAAESTNRGPISEFFFVSELARLINDYRRAQGLDPLDLAPDLDGLAGSHSTAMLVEGRLSHDGFHDRYLRTGSRVCVENVARNFRTPAALLEGWRRSPAHHRNLLEPKVSRMAIAVRAHYVTFFACR